MAASKPDTARGNLVADVSEFVGRRQEVADAKRILGQSRLVTLTGPGGIGKTRLALRLAFEVRRAFTDGIWSVQLETVRDPALIAREVARALGFTDRTTSWAVATLSEYLAGREALLVLDNCEHLLDPCAVLVETILHSCHGVRIVTTSREPLGVTGEVVVPVPAMSLPDMAVPIDEGRLLRSEAGRLFLRRAADVCPGFAATPENAQVVGELVTRLEGIPLAIELAAARVRSLSPREILDRLEDRFTLLSAGRRTAEARQQTLSATIAWSYQLLSADERTMWRRASVFSGSFDLESAEAVCAGDGVPSGEIYGLVDGLVGKSVLLREPGDARARYRWLDMVREYGEGELRASGEEDRWRRAHRDWFAQLAASFDYLGPEQVQWFDRLHSDHANLRAAIQFCLDRPDEASEGLRLVCDLWPYWETRGHLTEGRRLIAKALATVPPASPLFARGLWVSGYLDMVQGDLDPAAAHLEDAVVAGRACAEPTVAYALEFLGRTRWMLGDVTGGMQLTEQALARHRANHDWRGVVLTLVQLGVIATLADDPTDVDGWLAECIATCGQHGERWNRAYALWVSGLVAWRRGEIAEATDRGIEALTLKREVRDPIGTPLCVEALAWIAASAGEAQRAATLLGAVEEAWLNLPWSLPEPLRVHHAACLTKVRSALTASEYDAAYAEGCALDADQAVRFALREPKPDGRVARPITLVSDEQLTERERQIAALVADGLSNAQIGRTLVVSARTVETHVRHIMDKLGFSSRAHIAGWIAAGEVTGTEV
jgi:predicted ATPase/DNA-binding CsgD family transcriptional regulator